MSARAGAWLGKRYFAGARTRVMAVRRGRLIAPLLLLIMPVCAWGILGAPGAYSEAGGAHPPAVSDSGVLNQAWERWVADHGLPGSEGCQKATTDRGSGVLGRIDPELADEANEPHDLISSGRLAVPVLHVWNRNDQNSCGAAIMDCPLPDGTSSS